MFQTELFYDMSLHGHVTRLGPFTGPTHVSMHDCRPICHSLQGILPVQRLVHHNGPSRGLFAPEHPSLVDAPFASTDG